MSDDLVDLHHDFLGHKVRQRHSLTFVKNQAISTFLMEVQMPVTNLHYILTPILLWKAGLHFVDQVEELFFVCGEVRLKETLLKDGAVYLSPICLRWMRVPVSYSRLPLQYLTLLSSHR